MLFYNCTFITLNFIRPVLEKYSRVLVFNTLLYSNTSELLILYSTRVFIFTSILYSTWVVKFQYFTQHCNLYVFIFFNFLKFLYYFLLMYFTRYDKSCRKTEFVVSLNIQDKVYLVRFNTMKSFWCQGYLLYYTKEKSGKGR